MVYGVRGQPDPRVKSNPPRIPGVGERYGVLNDTIEPLNSQPKPLFTASVPFHNHQSLSRHWTMRSTICLPATYPSQAPHSEHPVCPLIKQGWVIVRSTRYSVLYHITFARPIRRTLSQYLPPTITLAFGGCDNYHCPVLSAKTSTYSPNRNHELRGESRIQAEEIIQA